MTATPRPRPAPRLSRPAAALFLCLLAGQSSLLALSPVLADVARAFDVSTGTAGQIRSLSGGVAVAAALALTWVVRRLGVRDVLLAGLGLLAVGSLAGATAPSLTAMAVAQAPTGAGLALVLSGGLAAASQWAPPGQRARVLSWALIGQPVAWVAGMPLVGLVGDAGWRYALALPLAPALLAAAAVARRPADRPAAAGGGTVPGLLRRPQVARWALGELLAYTAWCGTLVYVGAVLVETYRASAATVGVVLAAAGAAYVPGNLLARGSADRRARALVVGLAGAGAPIMVLLGSLRPSLALSAALLCALSFLSGARTIAASALGLAVGREDPLAAMSLRTAAVQGGYLLGAALGGLALALGGPAGLGAALGGVLALAGIAHAPRRDAVTGVREEPDARPLVRGTGDQAATGPGAPGQHAPARA